MFDYRNLNSDYRRPLPPDPGDAWVWIAGAILLLLVLAVAFVSYEPIQPPCRPFLLNESTWVARAQSEQNRAWPARCACSGEAS
jgi:peptidoglycan/LPS O-acetylase OafA/YrhL